MKKAFKKVINKLGVKAYKTSSIPLGTDVFTDISIHFSGCSIKYVFDVGANNGQSIDKVRERVTNPEIIAFEPIRSTFEKLSQNHKNTPNVTLENIGLGAKREQLKIGLASNTLWNSLNRAPHGDSEEQNETVKVDTLDNYIETNAIEKIHLLKIDVEGFESKVLQGAHKALTNNKVDFILCEVGIYEEDKHHTPFRDILNQLAKYDFKFVSFYDQSLIQSDAHFANALFYNSKELSFQ